MMTIIIFHFFCFEFSIFPPKDELLLGDNSSGPQQSDRNESKKENVPPVDESSVINTSIGKIDHAQKSAEIENVASNTGKD